MPKLPMHFPNVLKDFEKKRKDILNSPRHAIILHCNFFLSNHKRTLCKEEYILGFNPNGAFLGRAGK